jgi:integrase
VSELFSLALEEANDVESTAEWRIAPERQKMRESKRHLAKAHVVPLSRQAAAVFRHRLRAVGGSEVLFPRVRVPRTIANPSAWWSSRWIRKLNERMSELLGTPVPTWKVHNLRHTLATHIEEELHVAESTTAGTLGHSSGGGVTRRYALASTSPIVARPCRPGRTGWTGSGEQASGWPAGRPVATERPLR